MKLYTLLLDYDEYGWPELRYASELLDFVRLDARRFLAYPKIGGMIVIKRTWAGYHLRAPHARLTHEEQETLARMSHSDSGYKFWLSRHGKATLRIGKKVIVKQIGGRFVGKKIIRSSPQIIEVLKC